MKTYSVSEACEIIGCDSERWLLTRVRNGTFPARKVVRDIRFTDGDLTAILDACTYQPSAEDIFVPQLSERSRKRAG